MQSDGSPMSAHVATAHVATAQLSGLLDGLVTEVPGSLRALLTSGDGLKVAWTDQPKDDADSWAAVVSGLSSMARQAFPGIQGSMRQIVIEHDGGYLFVMSAGADFTDTKAVGTVLAVMAKRNADPGQAFYAMESFVRSLDEHLVVQARPRTYAGSGL